MTQRRKIAKLAKMFRDLGASYGTSYKYAREAYDVGSVYLTIWKYFPKLDYDIDRGYYCDMCRCYHGTITFAGHTFSYDS